VWWGGRAIQTVGLSRQQARRMIAESAAIIVPRPRSPNSQCSTTAPRLASTAG